MSVLISCADGNIGDVAAWAVADPTSFADTSGGTSNASTGIGSSVAFTPGAITIDAIMLNCFSRISTATGTVTVKLRNAGVDVAGSIVTVNTTDIPYCSAGGTQNQRTYILFKFAAPITLLAATAYTVGVLASVAGQIAFFTTATASDWLKALRTTTHQAPVPGTDRLIIVGGLTGPGTDEGVRTITINTTSLVNSYGNSAARQTGSIDIGNHGLLTSGVAPSTAYQFQCYGLNVMAGGELRLGSISGTPIPVTSSVKLQFNNAANADCGLEVFGGTLNLCGTPPGGWTGSGISATPAAWVHRARLASTAVNAATVLTTDVATGWINNDAIIIAITNPVVGAVGDNRVVSSSSGTTLTITTGISSVRTVIPAAGIQAEIINLTRNVDISGTSSTFQSYIWIHEGVVSCYFTEVFNLGANINGKTGFASDATTGPVNIVYSSAHDFLVTGSQGISINAAQANLGSANCSRNVASNILAAGFSIGGSIANNMHGVTFQDNAVMKSSGHGIDLFGQWTGASSSGNWCIGINSHGIYCQATLSDLTNTIVSHVLYSGLTLSSVATTPPLGLDLSGSTFYRNGQSGIMVGLAAGVGVFGVIHGTGLIFVGNVNAGITSDIQPFVGTLVLRDSYFVGEVEAFSSTWAGVRILSRGASTIYLENCSFGTGLPSARTHSIADVDISPNFQYPLTFARVVIRGGSLLATTMINGQDGLSADENAGVFLQDVTINGGSVVTRAYTAYGTTSKDTTIYDPTSTDTVSERLTPICVTRKLASARRLVAAASGQAVTISGKIRRSATPSATPDSLVGLQLWLAADSSSKWQDSARTVPAVGDGDPVGAWDDLSGNHYSFLQGTAGYRPLLKLGIQNGHPAIRFDALDDFLDAGNVLSGLSALTVISVVRSSVTKNLVLDILAKQNSFSSANGEWDFGIRNSNNSVAQLSFAANQPGPVGPTIVPIPVLNAQNTWTMVTVTWQGSQFPSVYEKGTQFPTITAGIWNAVAVMPTTTSTLKIGVVAGFSNAGGGDIAEVISYNRALGSDERKSIENYLSAKYNVPVIDPDAYNGNPPRLIIERSNTLGTAFNADIVAWTSSAPMDGTWENFSYTTPAFGDDSAASFYIDCDGTNGFVNVDSLAVS